MENILKPAGLGIIKAAAWCVIAVLGTISLKTLSFLFIPFSIALLLCYALGIPLEFLQRFHIPNALRILIVIFFILTVFYLFGRLIYVNMQEFQAQYPVFEAKFWEYGTALLSRFNISTEQAKEAYDAFMASLNLKATDLKPVGIVLKSLSGSFFSFLGNMFWVILIMVFMLAERDNFTRRIIKMQGKEKARHVLDSFERINKAVQSYLGLKTLMSALTGFLVCVFLLLFQVPFALLWGVLAFALNFIPNIGSIIAVIPPVLITFFQFGSLPKALTVALVLVAIQMVVGNILEPKLMGKGLNLSPLVVLLSLVFWGWMWGLPGMLLSVPLTAAFKIALEQIEVTRPVAVLMSGK